MNHRYIHGHHGKSVDWAVKVIKINIVINIRWAVGG